VVAHGVQADFKVTTGNLFIPDHQPALIADPGALATDEKLIVNGHGELAATMIHKKAAQWFVSRFAGHVTSLSPEQGVVIRSEPLVCFEVRPELIDRPAWLY
jgi:hypothetical protein